MTWPVRAAARLISIVEFGNSRVQKLRYRRIARVWGSPDARQVNYVVRSVAVDSLADACMSSIVRTIVFSGLISKRGRNANGHHLCKLVLLSCASATHSASASRRSARTPPPRWAWTLYLLALIFASFGVGGFLDFMPWWLAPSSCCRSSPFHRHAHRRHLHRLLVRAAGHALAHSSSGSAASCR